MPLVRGKHFADDVRVGEVQRFNRQRLVVLALVALASCAAGVALCFVTAQLRGPFSSGGWFNRFWFAFFAVACFLGGVFVTCRDWLVEKPERLYLVVVLCVTTLFAWSMSVRTMGWDVGTHYRNILYFADWEGPVDYTESDRSVVNVEPLGEDGGLLHAIDAREEALDANDGATADTTENNKPLVWYLTGIEYVPYALVMKICDAVGVSFSHTLTLMRMTGALFYSVVTYLGMRKLRERKMLFAVVALLPTSVFLAAELGYSYWLFSLCLYGFATLAGMMQGSVEVRLTTILAMLGALFVGMLPRVVYFPLMFLCLLIPLERFSSPKLGWVYRVGLVGAAVLAFSVWLVPKLLVNFGTGDVRGGEVNPSAQIAYILSHPVEYAQTFLRFVLPPLRMENGGADVEGVNLVQGFLSIEASPGLLVNYGYLPRAGMGFAAVAWVALVWTTLTDRDGSQCMGWLPGLLSFVLCAGVFVMIVTALYFEFTPVGLDTIHGVQRRYLLPLLFPLLAFVGPASLGLRGRVRAGLYDGAVLSVMACLLLTSWWTVSVGLIV